MSICLFFGSFNPIHNAHLRIAEFVLSEFGFEKVVLIPAFNPPHKVITSSKHRLQMVKCAIEKRLGLEVSDIEFRLGNISYTYLTILELLKEYPQVKKFDFLIGTDAFEKIESWYEVEELKKYLRFVVFSRENDCDFSRFDYLKSKGYDFIFTTLDFCDISSTEIRKNIALGKSLEGLVPSAVEEYINANGLYR